MHSNGHVRFGGRAGETGREQSRYCAPARPYYGEDAAAGRNFGEGSPVFALSVAGDATGRTGDAFEGAGADGETRQQQGTVERVALEGGGPGAPGQFAPQVGGVAADHAPGAGAVGTAGGLEPVRCGCGW